MNPPGPAAPQSAPGAQPPLLPSQRERLRQQTITSNICQVILWASWVFAMLLYGLSAQFLKSDGAAYDTFDRPFNAYPIGLMVFSITVCGGLRWWMTRADDPYLVLFICWGALCFDYLTQCFGYFFVLSYCVVFQILAAVLLLLYFPPLVRTTPRPLRPALPHAGRLPSTLNSKH